MHLLLPFPRELLLVPVMLLMRVRMSFRWQDGHDGADRLGRVDDDGYEERRASRTQPPWPPSRLLLLLGNAVVS